MATRKAAGRLVAFRLEDVDLKLRLHGARVVATASARAVDDAVKPEDMLFARLLEIRAVPTLSRERMEEVARHPSRTVYRVSAEAWDRVMGTNR